MRKLKHYVGGVPEQDEIVVVTTRQYEAVADDILRTLFPDLDVALSAHRSQNVTLFITDDYSIRH